MDGIEFSTPLGIDYSKAIADDEKKKRKLLLTTEVDIGWLEKCDLLELVGKPLTADVINIKTNTKYAITGHKITFDELSMWKNSGIRIIHLLKED
jgi:hypothetical protein